MEELKIGDVVTLKSATSIKMTIEKIYKPDLSDINMVVCVWFDHSCLKRDKNGVEALIKSKPSTCCM